MYVTDVAAQERAKYAEIWSIPEYSAHSPGLENVERFMQIMHPRAGASIIDIGAGACVAGLEFMKRGLDVWWLDITDAACPNTVGRDRFFECALWAYWGRGQTWDYGFCCDVLEHIPTEYTMLCIDRILSRCKTAWIQIALRPDEFGKVIGEPLHLTVRSFDWWKVRLATIGTVVDARDLCGDGLYLVTR